MDLSLVWSRLHFRVVFDFGVVFNFGVLLTFWVILIIIGAFIFWLAPFLSLFIFWGTSFLRSFSFLVKPAYIVLACLQQQATSSDDAWL